MQNKEIVVAYKGDKKLKELLTRADPYNIISNVDDEIMLMMKCTRMFLASKSVVHVQTLWSQKLVSNVSLQREFKKLGCLPHAFPKM